jgi:hypothetical protein
MNDECRAIDMNSEDRGLFFTIALRSAAEQEPDGAAGRQLKSSGRCGQPNGSGVHN